LTKIIIIGGYLGHNMSEQRIREYVETEGPVTITKIVDDLPYNRDQAENALFGLLDSGEISGHLTNPSIVEYTTA